MGLGKVEVQTFVWPYCVHAHMCFFFFSTLTFIEHTLVSQKNTEHDLRL